MAFNQGNTKAGKLTAVEVLQIREKYATGLYTYDRLALEYGVATNTVRSIVKGTSWQNVPMITPGHVIDDAALRSQRKLEAMLAGAGALPVESELEVDDETLAAMQHAVESMPQPEFLKPNADQAARMAAYGVRPPTPKELIEQLARPIPATERGPISAPVHTQSKPVIQAQSAVERPPAPGDVGGGLATIPSRQATPDVVQVSDLDRFLEQVTEESGK